MPRPSDHERKRIQDRRDAKQASRDADAQRDAATRKKVETIIDNALNRSKTASALPDRIELVNRLEEHRLAALATWPPQVRAANEAAFMQARLLGLVIDQQAILTAQVEAPQLTGDIEDKRAMLVEMLAEKHGHQRAAQIAALIEHKDGNGPIIDGKARDE